MSRQSYMTGFCKAASAAGVDPQALAQYAMSKRTEKVAAYEQAGKPRFETNGWAPKGIRTDKIPTVIAPGIVLDGGVDGWNGRLREPSLHALNEFARDEPVTGAEAALYRKAYPQWGAWHDAHTNAMQSVLNKYHEDASRAGLDSGRNYPNWLREAVRRDYNKAMFEGTNTPVRVQSPKK